MPSFTPSEKLTCNPLTKEEKAAIRRLERALLAMPRNLMLATIGDAGLSVIDKAAADGVGLHDGGAARAGVELAHIKSNCLIAGISG